MLFMERNTSSYTRVLCIKRSVKYDIPPFATMRRLTKLLVACPSAIREIGRTNRRLGSRPRRAVGAVAANDGNQPQMAWARMSQKGQNRKLPLSNMGSRLAPKRA